MDRASLQWVQEDIEDSLRQGRIALESFADDPSEGESLRVCADTLHSVRGVLEMLEVYGCSLLFDEMEGIIDGLMAGAITRRDDACEVLMQGIVQVPDYLDFIARGNRDNAVVLMPLLNDIRSVRGMPSLSENSLFAPALDAPLPVSERPVALDGDEFVAHMRKLRPYFQRGLVGWYRGDDLPSAFQMLDAVVLHVEKAVGSSPCARLWWVARALVQALRTEGIDHSVSLKLLLAQVDRQLKALASRGVEGCQQTPPEDLLKNLLYYVARSSTRSRRIDAVRSTFKLGQLVSADQALSLSNSPLFGPNLDTFTSVSVAVQESLARIQDALDSYSRKEDKNAEELVLLSAMLQEVADTLGLLGLGIPRRSILEQRDVVEELTEAGTVPTNDQLMDIAGVVLGIDAAMNVLAEQGLERTIDDAEPDEALDPADSNLTGIEYLQLVTSVIGEIKTDLAVVKDAIATFLEDPSQRRRLDDVPRRVEQVIGGMRMLYLQPAADLMDRWLRFVDRVLLNSQALPDTGTLEQLADGVESIEYYLESVANARSDAEQRLAGAQQRIGALPQDMGESTAVPEIQMLLVDGDIQALRGQLEAVDAALDPGDTPTVDFLVDEVQSDAERAIGTGGEVDFPLSSDSALDAEEITMFDVSEPDAGVGAALWNTGIVRDQTAGSQPAVADPVGLDDTAIALAQLPSQSDQVTAASDADTLVADVSAGEDETVDGDFSTETDVDDDTGFWEPPVDVPLPSSVAETLAHAQSLLERMSADDVAAANTNSDATLDVAAVVEFESALTINSGFAPNLAPEIAEIFLEEAVEVLGELQSELPRWATDTVDHNALATVRRSFHTLKGSGRMVGASNIGEFSWAIENLLNRVIDGVVSASPAVIALVVEASDTLPSLIDELRGEASAEVDIDYICTRAETLARESATHTGFYDGGAWGDGETVSYNHDATVVVTADAPSEAPAESIDSSAEILEFPLRRVPPEDALNTAFTSVSELFGNEAVGHLDTIDASLQNPGDLAYTEPRTYLRAMHTLAGGARAAGFDHIAEVGSSMESYLGILAQLSEPLDAAGISLLSAASARLRSANSEARSDTDPAVAGGEELVKQAQALEQEVLNRLEPTEGRQDNFSVDPDSTLSERLEFREAFLEEAAVILDSFDWVVSNWRDNGNSEPMMAELLRGLHTLKGGARMVQAGPLSDLSHALESALTAASNTQQPMNGGVLSMVEVVHDRIADMLDCMVAHQPLIPATDLIAQMQARDWVQTNWSGVESLDPSIDDGGAPTDNAIDRAFDSGAETLDRTRAEYHAEAAGDDALASDSEHDVSGLLQAGAAVGFAGAALGGQFGSELPSPEVGDVEGVAAQAKAAQLDEHAEGSRDDVDVDHTSAPELASVPSFATQVAESLDALRQSTDDGAGQFDVTASPELPADASDTAAEFAADATFVGDAESSMATAAVGEASAEQAPPESISDPDSEEVAAALHDSASAEPELSSVGAEEAPLAERAERIQVDAEVLDNLVGFAGEISISQGRIELQVGAFRQNLDEMNQTVVRLREQLRRLELETESQIIYRHERESSEQERADFDPLELDRFSRMQDLSRGLAESVGDLTNIQDMLEGLIRESESILVQQARTNTDLQHGLMQTRMLPFDRMVPRFRRIVRQTSRELKKQVRLEIEGDDIRIDRAILNRMVGPLEHIFRNAVDHGIESEAQRIEQGKPAEACISVSISRDGPEVEIRIADDGDGVPLDAVRSRALQRELLVPGVQLPDADLLQFIFEPAFSTSRSVTQISGHGVGLDVVQNEVKQLGGSVRVESPPDSGAVFVIRLPLTLTVNQALMVSVGAEELGLPLSNVDAVLRISAELAQELENDPNPTFEHGGIDYPFIYLGASLGVAAPSYHQERYPVILIRAGENRLAVRIDELRGRQEVVVKSVGPMLSAIRWVSGATIMGDGRVVLILDAPTLVRMATSLRRRIPIPIVADVEGAGRVVMVVDDSITVRKVTGRFLQRNGMQVVIAKDGLEALAMLQDQLPDVMLLDIEVPRMDGFELATTIRNDSRMAALPIIMITSRTGQKHTERARQIGIDRYLGKPYHEGELLDNINALLTGSRRVRA